MMSESEPEVTPSPYVRYVIEQFVDAVTYSTVITALYLLFGTVVGLEVLPRYAVAIGLGSFGFSLMGGFYFRKRWRKLKGPSSESDG